MRLKRHWLAGTAFGLVGLAGCQTWTSGLTLPSPRYLTHYPQYFSADPMFPLQREQASMEDPAGAAARAGGVGPAPLAPGPPQALGPGTPPGVIAQPGR